VQEEDSGYLLPDWDQPLLQALWRLVGKPVYVLVSVGGEPLAAVHASLARVQTFDQEEFLSEGVWLNFDEDPTGTRLMVDPHALTGIEWDDHDRLRIDTDQPVQITLTDRSPEARVAFAWRTLRRARADKTPGGQRVYGFFVELFRQELADSTDETLTLGLRNVLAWADSDEPDEPFDPDDFPF
jgi:hypothetical protein